MANEGTRTFVGKYSSKDGKTHKVIIKIFKRFTTLGLAITITSFSGVAITTFVKEATANIEKDEEINSDLFAIESIISKKPHILKDIEKGTYTIKAGDTISAIAEENSNTVKRICSLNNMSSKQVIYPGQEIQIETIKDKTPEDKDIVALESYFYDYIFNSPIAELAKSSGDNKSYVASVYRTLLYGNPKSESELDPNSIYGEYVTGYLKFHNLSEPNIDEKREYISKLTELSRKTHDDLTLGNTTDTLVPYTQYRIYLENGTTKYDELKITGHSIYE